MGLEMFRDIAFSEFTVLNDKLFFSPNGIVNSCILPNVTIKPVSHPQIFT